MDDKGSEEKMIQNQRNERTVKSAAATLRNVGKSSFPSSVQIELTGGGEEGVSPLADGRCRDDPFGGQWTRSIGRTDIPQFKRDPFIFRLRFRGCKARKFQKLKTAEGCREL